MEFFAFVAITSFALGALSAVAPRAHAIEPCCSITAIDARTQMVTARDARTGRTFQFKVAETRALATLKVGQPVFADFTTLKVSIQPDGLEPCCSVVNLRTPATPRVR
jgi:hypothetical protein